MGLTLGVGLFAFVNKENAFDGDDCSNHYDALNEILLEAGMALYSDPNDFPVDEIFDVQMWGYSGLHAIRRLAAHFVCTGTLPVPSLNTDYAADPLIQRLNEQFLDGLNLKYNGLPKFGFSKPKSPPRFEHLMMHSDSEGYYLPTEFRHVVFDTADRSGGGVGGMIGSAPCLLKECLELAALLNLPLELDIESEEFWLNADSPPAQGELWQIYGVEAFGLARLIRGCNVAIKHNAALVFC
jgi:hypothetical protein